ncbi:MAG: YeiH family protein [Luteolibacter sp.]
MNLVRMLCRYLPGLGLCAAVTFAALLLEQWQVRWLGKPWIEALVVAILLGALVRTFWSPPRSFDRGIQFTTKTVLELAVVLMGATVGFHEIRAIGLPLALSIIVTVFGTIGASFLLGRVLGLPRKMAMLVACGNAICGNSAIAAVAPVIEADSDEVATSIAFTAVLGIGVVIALPILATALHLSPAAGGVFAGLTVYAVPQVLAAAGPMGGPAVQIGTLVKLVRVLMLGPVVTGLSVMKGRRGVQEHPAKPCTALRMVPPFIIAFLALAVARTCGFLADTVVNQAHAASGHLTILAMAGLGLGVDLRSVSKAGPRVIFVVTASLILLGATALLMLRMTGFA